MATITVVTPWCNAQFAIVVGEGPLASVQRELHEAIEAGHTGYAHALACELEKRHLGTRKALARATNTDVQHPDAVSAFRDWPPYTDIEYRTWVAGVAA